MSRSRIARLAGALAAALAVAASASPALACTRGYSYAGLYSSSPAFGVAASLSMLAPPSVDGGHVAAWVGVGGPGLGPRGTDEWLQVGLASFAGSPETRLYYELALPGQAPRYVELASGIRPGEVVRVGLLELPFAPGTWIVVTPQGLAGPFYLPPAPAPWAPVATAESWTPAGSLCNGYSYRFGDVQLAGHDGGWKPLRRAHKLQDRGALVRRSSRSTFTARAA
ncbi:MAG TPA: hypothetical protein VLU96_07625 [Gaiellaceae bacterium]|nr:hypothetical protein [Gaiellaceae bacterium]